VINLFTRSKKICRLGRKISGTIHYRTRWCCDRHDWQVNTIDGPTKLVRQDAILGGLSIGQLRHFSYDTRLFMVYSCRLIEKNIHWKTVPNHVAWTSLAFFLIRSTERVWTEFINHFKVVIHVEMPKAAPKKSICHFQKLEMIIKIIELK